MQTVGFPMRRFIWSLILDSKVLVTDEITLITDKLLLEGLPLVSKSGKVFVEGQLDSNNSVYKLYLYFIETVKNRKKLPVWKLRSTDSQNFSANSEQRRKRMSHVNRLVQGRNEMSLMMRRRAETRTKMMMMSHIILKIYHLAGMER